jgi:hypothetical protein
MKTIFHPVHSAVSKLRRAKNKRPRLQQSTALQVKKEEQTKYN